MAKKTYTYNPKKYQGGGFNQPSPITLNIATKLGHFAQNPLGYLSNINIPNPFSSAQTCIA